MFSTTPTAVEMGAARPIFVRLALGWISSFLFSASCTFQSGSAYPVDNLAFYVQVPEIHKKCYGCYDSERIVIM